MADEQTIAIAPLLKMQQELKADDFMLSGFLFVRYTQGVYLPNRPETKRSDLGDGLDTSCNVYNVTYMNISYTRI